MRGQEVRSILADVIIAEKGDVLLYGFHIRSTHHAVANLTKMQI